ncbi:MAG: chemotaxis protein CheW [Anaeromyxobacter sp.]
MDPSSNPGPTGAEETATRAEQLVQFAAETAEVLDGLDEQLLHAERDPHLFSVQAVDDAYLAISTRAAALRLDGIAPLTASTHAFVRCHRDRNAPIGGAGLDVLYDAGGLVRAYLDEIFVHLDAGTALPDGGEAAPVVERLASLRAGGSVDEAPLPEVRGGERLGELLAGPPFDVPQAVIDRALEAQVKSGRRLGEELVASHLVDASVVGRALRAQARHARGADGPAQGQRNVLTRVEQARLDVLMEAIGELVVVESALRSVPEFRGATSEAGRRLMGQLAKVTRELTDAGTRLRMDHASELFHRVSRGARDLARRAGKQVRIVTHGDSTELDRLIVDNLADPLLALVRAAIAYGIEPRADREAAGKQGRGTVRISARTEAGQVVVEVADDGAGVDRAAVIERLRAAGQEPASDAPMDALLLAPAAWPPPGDPDGGGPLPSLDAIKLRLEGLRGRVHATSAPGAGTTVRLVLPLTLTTVDAMLIACGKEKFLVPTLAVVESIRPDADMVKTRAGGHEALSMRGRILPLVRLGSLLEIPDAHRDPAEALVMVLESEDRRFGLLVDDVLAQQQVVVKSLGSGLEHVELFGGAGIHGAGQVGLILNVRALVQAAAA